MGLEPTKDYQLFTPAVARTEVTLPLMRKNPRKALTRELTENDLILMHLPEAPFVQDGERLNRSCPLDLLNDSDDEEDEEQPQVEAFHASYSTGHFLQPRTDANASKALVRASLLRMSGQGSTKLSFHQSFRLPKKGNKSTPKIGDASEEASSAQTKKVTAEPTEKRKGLRRNLMRRQISADCA